MDLRTDDARRPAPPGTVVVAVVDGVQSLDVTGPWEVFTGANEVTGERGPRYALTLASPAGGPVRTHSGLELATRPFRDCPADIATLVVPGGVGPRTCWTDVATVAAFRDLRARSRRVLSVCTGAFLVAACGLSDGARLATHWAHAEELATAFPRLTVDRRAIAVRDGTVWSSAGVTAGMDAALAIIEHDLGPDVAGRVARDLVMYLRRPGSQSQFAAPVWTARAASDPIRRAQELIESEPAGDLRIATLATAVGVSERHFIRRFRAEVGSPPSRFVAAVRLQHARLLLESTTDTLATIARRSGFGSAESLRRAFARDLDITPDAYRRRFTRSSA